MPACDVIVALWGRLDGDDAALAQNSELAKLSQKIEYGDPVIGDKPFEMVMLVDYPNYEAVRKVFHSEAYQAIIPERDKAFLKYNICLVQTNDLKM